MFKVLLGYIFLQYEQSKPCQGSLTHSGSIGVKSDYEI